jgi:hypothetical protein
VVHKAQEASAILRDLVQALIDGGMLNLGQGYALTSRLDAIHHDLADRDIEDAARLFEALISEVRTFVNEGTLTADQGQPLIDGAQNALNQLNV